MNRIIHNILPGLAILAVLICLILLIDRSIFGLIILGLILSTIIYALEQIVKYFSRPKSKNEIKKHINRNKSINCKKIINYIIIIIVVIIIMGRIYYTAFYDVPKEIIDRAVYYGLINEEKTSDIFLNRFYGERKYFIIGIYITLVYLVPKILMLLIKFIKRRTNRFKKTHLKIVINGIIIAIVLGIFFSVTDNLQLKIRELRIKINENNMHTKQEEDQKKGEEERKEMMNNIEKRTNELKNDEQERKRQQENFDILQEDIDLE